MRSSSSSVSASSIMSASVMPLLNPALRWVSTPVAKRKTRGVDRTVDARRHASSPAQQPRALHLPAKRHVRAIAPRRPYASRREPTSVGWPAHDRSRGPRPWAQVCRAVQIPAGSTIPCARRGRGAPRDLGPAVFRRSPATARVPCGMAGFEPTSTPRRVGGPIPPSCRATPSLCYHVPVVSAPCGRLLRDATRSMRHHLRTSHCRGWPGLEPGSWLSLSARARSAIELPPVAAGDGPSTSPRTGCDPGRRGVFEGRCAGQAAGFAARRPRFLPPCALPGSRTLARSRRADPAPPQCFSASFKLLR